MTAQDHRDIGSTPPSILSDNEGKCRAEIFDDSQLNDYLGKQTKGIESILAMDNEVRKNFLGFIERHVADLEYLASVGKLPPEYKTNMASYTAAIRQ